MPKVLTEEEKIKRLNDALIKKNGKVLSDISNLKTSKKYIFKCENEKHKPFSLNFSSLINMKSWCKECAFDKNFNDIPDEFLKEDLPRGICQANYLLSFFNSKVISKTYKNHTTRLICQCNNPDHSPFTTTLLYLTKRSKKTHYCVDCIDDLKK